MNLNEFILELGVPEEVIISGVDVNLTIAPNYKDLIDISKGFYKELQTYKFRGLALNLALLTVWRVYRALSVNFILERWKRFRPFVAEIAAINNIYKDNRMNLRTPESAALIVDFIKVLIARTSTDLEDYYNRRLISTANKKAYEMLTEVTGLQPKIHQAVLTANIIPLNAAASSISDDLFGIRMNKTFISIAGEWHDAKGAIPSVKMPPMINELKRLSFVQYPGLHAIVGGSSQFKTSFLSVLAKAASFEWHSSFLTFLEREQHRPDPNFPNLEYSRIANEDLIAHALYSLLASGSHSFLDSLAFLSRTAMSVTQTYGLDTGMSLLFFSLNSFLKELNDNMCFFTNIAPPLQAEGYLAFLNEFSLCTTGLWIPIWVDQKDEKAICFTSQRRDPGSELTREYQLGVVWADHDSLTAMSAFIPMRLSRPDIAFMAAKAYQMPSSLSGFKEGSAEKLAQLYGAVGAKAKTLASIPTNMWTVDIFKEAKADARPSFFSNMKGHFNF